MKKTILRLAALVLACLLLAGCAGIGSYGVVKYADMTYTRPDMAALQQSLNDACEAAKSDDLDTVIAGIYAFYDSYDDFYTNYSLADIKYCGDLTDIYWEGEYNYCADNAATVDAGLDTLYRALAQSPCRTELEGEDYFGAGYFRDYESETIWDQGYMALMEAESDLVSQYYALSSQGLAHEQGSQAYYDAVADDMAQVLVDLIGLRQATAAYLGYSSYVDYVYDAYYYRDYTPAQAAEYLEEIRTELVDVYRRTAESDVWDGTWESATQAQTLAYVRGMAKAMGGTIQDAFSLLEAGGLYDISYGENKYGASFETYLYSYYEPFIFMNSTGTVYDKLTLAHEFGHFCNDYACYGSYAGTDVMEVISQGMEYLSLCYADGGEKLTKLKMADSLCVYVEQAAFAAFEQQIYGLEGENLTVENLYALYDQTVKDFGLDSYDYDRREFVTITHYFTNPMYIISYVVSNDAALQMYQLEQQTPGAGLAVMENSIYTEEAWFESFLKSVGLTSPFTSGRVQEVKKTFEELF